MFPWLHLVSFDVPLLVVCELNPVFHAVTVRHNVDLRVGAERATHLSPAACVRPGDSRWGLLCPRMTVTLLTIGNRRYRIPESPESVESTLFTALGSEGAPARFDLLPKGRLLVSDHMVVTIEEAHDGEERRGRQVRVLG